MKTFWQEFKDSFWFVVFFVLAIELIENDGSGFLIEMAGDLFGAFALVLIVVALAFNED